MTDSNNTSILFDGDAYEKNHGHLSRSVGQKFANLLSLSVDLRRLDVGCGTGTATEGEPDNDRSAGAATWLARICRRVAPRSDWFRFRNRLKIERLYSLIKHFRKRFDH